MNTDFKKEEIDFEIQSEIMDLVSRCGAYEVIQEIITNELEKQELLEEHLKDS